MTGFRGGGARLTAAARRGAHHAQIRDLLPLPLPFPLFPPPPLLPLRPQAGSADDADDDLRFLLGHQGTCSLASEFGRTWVDSGGIADVEVGSDANGQPVLRFKLTPEGRQRLAKFTRDATGARMILKLDDEILSSATVAGPITEGRFQVSLPRSVAQMQLIARVIRSGPLSFPPAEVTVTPGSRPRV